MRDFRIIADYHTHTTYSHGSGSIEDNMKAGIAKGLREIGIADHGPGHRLYNFTREQLPIMRREIDRLNEKYAGQIRCLLNVEANILSLEGEIDVTEEDRQYYDMVLMGFHRFVHYRPGGQWHFLIKGLTMKNNAKLIAKSTDAFIKAVEKNKIDYITHPGDPLPLELLRLTESCVATGTGLELNNKHHNLGERMLQDMVGLGAEFYVGSDAHRPEDVGQFDYAYGIIERAKIPYERVKNLEEL